MTLEVVCQIEGVRCQVNVNGRWTTDRVKKEIWTACKDALDGKPMSDYFLCIKNVLAQKLVLLDVEYRNFSRSEAVEATSEAADDGVVTVHVYNRFARTLAFAGGDQEDDQDVPKTTLSTLISLDAVQQQNCPQGQGSGVVVQQKNEQAENFNDDDANSSKKEAEKSEVKKSETKKNDDDDDKVVARKSRRQLAASSPKSPRGSPRSPRRSRHKHHASSGGDSDGSDELRRSKGAGSGISGGDKKKRRSRGAPSAHTRELAAMRSSLASLIGRMDAELVRDEDSEQDGLSVDVLTGTEVMRRVKLMLANVVAGKSVDGDDLPGDQVAPPANSKYMFAREQLAFAREQRRAAMIESSRDIATTPLESRVANWDYEIDYSRLEPTIVEDLGEGSFAKVFKGKWQGRDVAVKVLKWDDSQDDEEKDWVVQDFTREVETLALLRHPKILCFYGASSVPPHLAIVTEFAEGGNLKELLRSPCKLPWSIRLRIVSEVAEGIHYLHSRDPKIVHRDIKAENVLLTGAELSVRIADFGLVKLKDGATIRREESFLVIENLIEHARCQREGRNNRGSRGNALASAIAGSSSPSSSGGAEPALSPKDGSDQPQRRNTPMLGNVRKRRLPMWDSYVQFNENTSLCGTPSFLAPEIIQMLPFNERVDIYAFGVLLWEVLTRQQPLPGATFTQVGKIVAEAGLRPEVPSYCPPLYRAIMEACWHTQPNKRPPISDVRALLRLASQEEKDFQVPN
jgi:serine/threonine protein kinase